ncbi:hypothetical protein NCM_04160 [Burkholderia pseudomallei]
MPPNSILATSRRYSVEPSARARSAIAPNASGVVSGASASTVAAIGALSGTALRPTSPIVTRALCARTADAISDAVRPSAAIFTGSGQIRIAYSAPQNCTLPTPSTRRSACNTFADAYSPSSTPDNRPSSDVSDTMICALSAAFSIEMPSRRTGSGSRASTIFRRFCTSTAARSALTPCLNVSDSDAWPALLVADVYSKPGTPFISRSITAVTDSSTTCADAPGYVA